VLGVDILGGLSGNFCRFSEGSAKNGMKILSLFAASNFRETVPLGLDIAAVRENATNEYEWLTGGRSETGHRGGEWVPALRRNCPRRCRHYTSENEPEPDFVND
jgi:hypothetical protein